MTHHGEQAADKADEIWSARGHVRAFKSGDPALAGPQPKAVLAAASTETNDQVLGTSVVEITGVRRGEHPYKIRLPCSRHR